MSTALPPGGQGQKRSHTEMEGALPTAGAPGAPNTPPGPPSAASAVPVARAVAVPPPTKKPNLGPTQSTQFASGVVYSAPPAQPAAPAPSNPASMPKVQDALGYLEKVKSRFSSAPVVYNQFLDIMKDFKSQNIDTEGVIKRVKNLFRGNRSLILGFNQFLPPGYKIELEPERRPTIEFKQAMEYVAKIKNRFREDPHIYAEFLEILHDYQAKRTIDEVYQRVQRLFNGQPDLLEEFKYFLPESAVQNKGAKPAKPGVKPGMAPKPGAKPVVKSTQPQKPMLDSKGRPIPAKPAGALASSADKSKLPAQGQGLKPKMVMKDGKMVPVSSMVSKDGKGLKDPRDRPHRPGVSFPPGCEKELALFERMKAHSTKPQWIQFLKVLNLFSNDLINRGELIRMVEDVYGDRSGTHGTADLVERFKQTIGYDEQEEKQVSVLNQTNYYAFVSSVDFNVCHQVTPSYRELPSQIQVPHASGRTALADEVLNDTCVSIPTGSEDFSFKSTRKNVYEENLFKCEDERFELDILIENIASAIRVLEPLAEQIASMPPEQAKRVRLPDTIDILHIRAIARVYGDQGYEMVELLNKSPTVATPVILTRLKQKDAEWRKVRNEMKSTWRKVNEQNYQRSLDHRSFYFKQEDKKRRSAKALVTELREVHHAVFGGSLTPPVKVEPVATRGEGGKKVLPTWGFEDLTGEESLMLRAIKQGQPPNPLFSYCMRFKYGDDAIHSQLFDIIAKVGGLILHSDAELLRVLLFFTGFVEHFFGVPVSEAQEARIVALTEKVTIEEEKKRKALEEAPELSMTDKEKAAEQALLGSSAIKDDKESDDEGKNDDMEDDEDKRASLTSPTAASAAAARGSKAKKKAGKKKTQKKKPVAGAAKQNMLANPSPKDDEDDDDMDLAEEKKDEEEDNGDVTAARARAQSALTLAANQLAAVKSLMNKIKVANDTQPDGSIPNSTLRPVKLHLETPWLADDKPSTTTPPLRKHGRQSTLFLGSHGYYIFFRLHQFAYERLATAKTLAHKARRNSSKKKLPVTAEEKHSRFNAMLDQLLEGELESSKFEDECRNLLGASSYVLFTIDKLLEQLVKQANLLLSTDNGLKVLSLYQYENRRVKACLAAYRKNQGSAPTAAAVPAEPLSILARQYQSDLSNLLGDDSACAIEYFHDTHELGIGLTEALDETNKHSPGEEWNQFVEEYLSEVPPVTVKTPFKKRNVRLAQRYLKNQLTAGLSAKEKAKKDAITDAQLLVQALKNVFQQSQLASKPDLRSFKLHFVEFTSDVLIRAAGKSGAAAKKTAAAEAAATKRKEAVKRRVTRFHAWVNKRLTDLAPLAAAQTAAGALGSMLGFDDMGEGEGEDNADAAAALAAASAAEDAGGEGEGEEGEDAMDTDAGAGGAEADQGFGALTAAAEDAEEGADEEEQEEDEDEPMA